MAQQLLDLFNREYSFNSYIPFENEIAVANLQNFSSQFTHVFGTCGCGKTHLLKAWINLANQKYNSVIYVDGMSSSAKQIASINLNNHRFIAVDNIDKLNDELQIKLFDLFNHIKLNQLDNYLLTSSNINLNHLASMRADLKTRILSGLVFGIKSLNEAELLNAMKIYTMREGIKIGEHELNHILTHYTRDLGKLLELINHISAEAMVKKKALITVTFINQLLN